jgi:hypothetical protein
MCESLVKIAFPKISSTRYHARASLCAWLSSCKKYISEIKIKKLKSYVLRVEICAVFINRNATFACAWSSCYKNISQKSKTRMADAYVLRLETEMRGI